LQKCLQNLFSIEILTFSDRSQQARFAGWRQGEEGNGWRRCRRRYTVSGESVEDVRQPGGNTED